MKMHPSVRQSEKKRKGGRKREKEKKETELDNFPERGVQDKSCFLLRFFYYFILFSYLHSFPRNPPAFSGAISPLPAIEFTVVPRFRRQPRDYTNITSTHGAGI